MRGTSWTAALVLTFGMAMLSLSSQAADPDPEACRTACSEAEEQCYAGCESAKDPEACEQKCTATADACMEACE